jgi:hypothetical protein
MAVRSGIAEMGYIQDILYLFVVDVIHIMCRIPVFVFLYTYKQILISPEFAQEVREPLREPLREHQ